MTSSPRARPFDWSNLRLRVLSGVVLATVAVAGVVRGHETFLVLVSVAVALLSLEWGRMSTREAPTRVSAAIAVAVLLALFTAYLGRTGPAWIVLAAGAATTALLARGLRWTPRGMDVALGVIYLGAPSLALLWLRSGRTGLAWTLILVGAAWAADIAAYIGGNLIGGPKLWPRFSPNKTWAGFGAGLAAAVLAAAATAMAVRRLGGPEPAHGVLIGLAAGLATMGGDLWESMLKRRFGVKDSGDLIPGHGGLLDRVDGLMCAALVLAAARLIAGALV